MASSIKLESLVHGDPVEIVQLQEGALTLGRADDNGVVIDSDSVSRNHACLFEVAGYWLLEDLNSTNGTLVNGVKLNAGQIRLLRDGDLAQIANFPIRVTLLPDEESSGIPSPPSLLVFSGTTFETEFPLASPGSKFLVGGDEGHLFLSEYQGAGPAVEISAGQAKLELETKGGGVSVIVNGMSASGVTSLSDRDEIDVGGYKIVVNDLRTSETMKQSRMMAVIQAQKDQPHAESVSIQAHIGTGTDPLSRRWEVDPMKRKLASNRKFVFGTSPEEEDVTGTVAMSRQEMNFKVGEVSVAKRLGQALREESQADSELKEQRQVVVGAVVLVILIGAAVYYFFAS